MPTVRLLPFSIVLVAGACHGSHLSGLDQALIFSSPDDPSAVNQTDAGVRIDFGPVVVATTKSLTLQFSSLGIEGTLGSLTALQPDAEFVLPFAPGAPVGPTPDSVTLSFTPETVGAKSAVFQLVVYESAPEPVTLELSGTSVPNGLTITPNPIDFGHLEIGQTAAKTVTITNNSAGSVTLEVSPLQTLEAGLPDGGGNPDSGADQRADGGADGGPSPPPHDGGPTFTLGSPSASTLAPSASASLDATFSPQSVGPAGASFYLNGDTANPFLLTGIGLESSLVADTPVFYGFVQLGQTWIQSVVIHNLSDTQTYHLTDFPQFSLPQVDSPFLLPYPAPTFPQTIPPASALQFPLFFEPTDLGHAAEGVAFFSDDPRSGVLDVALDGWGGGPHVECQSPLIFGPVAVGYSVTLPLTCANAGSNIPNYPQFTLQLSQAELTAGNPDFTSVLHLTDGGIAGPNGGVALEAGQQASLEVTFRPEDAGVVLSKLRVLSNNPDDADAGVLLEGEGVDPGVCDLGLTPSPLVFTEVPQGAKGVLQLGIENLGHDYCILTDVSLGAGSDPAYSFLSANPPYRLLSFAGNSDNPRHLPTEARADVQFAPSGLETLATGSVDVTVKNAVPATQSIDLTGVCAPSCLSVMPSSGDFGEVGFSPIDRRICTPDSRSFTVSNACTDPVTIEALALDPRLDAPAQFQLLDAPALPVTLDAGDSVGFQVAFVPTVTGDTVESVNLTSSEYPAMPYLISVRGDAEFTGMQTETFVAPPRQVDIAWVIDEDDDFPEVQNVEALIPDLFAALDEAQVDYQMAFTTTDTCVGTHSDQGSFEPCDHCLSTVASEPFFITPTTPNRATMMKDILDEFDVSPQLDWCTPINGDEHFFDSIADAFSPALLTGHNAGFLRPDAYLAIVVVNGDEEDDANDVHKGKPYLTTEFQTRNLVRALKADPTKATVSYINSGADSLTRDAAQLIGKLVVETGGVEVNINQDPGKLAFLNLLGQVADYASFRLSTPAVYPGDFVVAVDGVPTTHWAYLPKTNSILFETGSVPTPGQTITVTYPFGCP